MYALNSTDDYGNSINCTDNENNNFFIIIKHLFLSIPAYMLSCSIKGLVLYTMIEPLITNKC